MTAIHIRRVVAAMLVFAGMSGPDPSLAQEEGVPPVTLSNAEIEALYRARQDSARMRFTDADVEFVTGMISHHAQALVMSELAPTHGANPSVETLAARIINSQRDEIALMQRWLEDRGQPGQIQLNRTSKIKANRAGFGDEELSGRFQRLA